MKITRNNRLYYKIVFYVRVHNFFNRVSFESSKSKMIFDKYQ